jgi:hypothetical protein
MPSPDTLARFVEMVEGARFLEAIETFYAADATMQENEQPPRVGKPALLANERKVIGGTRRVTARCVPPLLVSGDHAVVRWVFEFEGRDGAVARIDELAYKRWRGEKIVEEKFFYDPSQMAASRAPNIKP